MQEDAGKLWDLLDEHQRAVIRAAAEVRRYPSGATLIREGDLSSWVLLLTAGRVKIVSSSLGGHEAVLAVREPGDILGEMAAMDGTPRSASAIAIEPVTALWLSAPAFAKVLAQEPGVATVLLKIIMNRLRYANNRRTEFGDSTAADRIAALLVDLAGRYGVAAGDGTDGTLIALRISQQDLAGLASASREAVTRTLRTLRDSGVLSTGRQRLVIRDLPALRRLAMLPDGLLPRG